MSGKPIGTRAVLDIHRDAMWQWERVTHETEDLRHQYIFLFANQVEDQLIVNLKQHARLIRSA